MGDDTIINNEVVHPKNEQELVKQLKRHLENWREILLPINSVLVWDKPFYPGLISGTVTLLFLCLWYFEPSILTTLSILGIVVCVADYAVPLVCANIFDPAKWTGTQERKFEEICKQLVQTRQQFLDYYAYMNTTRDTKPKLFFFSVLAALMFAAWIGNAFDNLLLTYFIVMAATLLPGIKHNAVLQQYLSQGSAALYGLMGQKKKKN